MDQTPLKRPNFFFTTAPMPCPYLDGSLERKVVTELIGADAEQLHESLSRAGFRRSHTIAYTPACPGCKACIPVRIQAENFNLRRSFKRILNRNKDLKSSVVPAQATQDQFDLFEKYQRERHGEGDMANMSFYDYRSMVEDTPIDTFIAEYRDQDGTLVACCLTDRLSDGLSAVYSFFDPELSERSLGTYMVLAMIEEAKLLGKAYVYLGYWIAQSQKMAYKAKFTPLEGFGPGGWSIIDPEKIMLGPYVK